MKVVKRIIIGIVFSFAIFYVLPAGLLRMPYFQEKISKQIASYLEDRLQTTVRIRQIDFEPFNKLILRDVYLEDQSGDTLLQAKRMAAGFEFFPLLHKKWRFHSIQLFTFSFNLSKETRDSPLNIQYIIDAFAQRDTLRKENSIDLQINRLNLYSGNFSYRVKDAEETPGRFNAENILLSNISSNMYVDNFNDKELSLQINSLGFDEHSGLRVKNIALDLKANEKTATIGQLTAELDKSVFLFTDILVDYADLIPTQSKPENVKFSMTLQSSMLYLKELCAFIPAVAHFDDRIGIEGRFSGTGNDLTIRDFRFRYYNQLMINANANIKNIFDSADSDRFYIRGKVSESFFSSEGMERLINNLSQQPFKLPASVRQLKNIHFTGDVNGSPNDLTAQGTLNTDVGVIQANLTLGRDEARFLKGWVMSDKLDLDKLMNDQNLGETAFNIRLDARQGADKKFSGVVDAIVGKFVYKGYTYSNLTMNGEFSPISFKGTLNLDSPEGNIFSEGLFVFNGNDSKFDFRIKASDLQLDKLNLTNKQKHSTLSFDLTADLIGNNPDNFTGVVSLDRLQFETEKGNYSLSGFRVTSAPLEPGKLLRIDSEILNGEIRGDYSFKTLLPVLKQTFARYLPSLVKPDTRYSIDEENNFSVQLTLEDTKTFCETFDLPFSLRGQTNISGRYDNRELDLTIATPQATIGGSKMDSLRLTFTNSDETAQLNIQGISLQKKNAQLRFAVQMDAADDKLNTSLNWGNDHSKYKGNLKLTTLFSKNNERPAMQMKTNIQQTDMIFNDSIWTLYPATVTIDSSKIQINNLQVINQDRFLKINGTIAHDPEEELRIELNRMDLEYIFQSLNIPALEFGGIATGHVTAKDVYLTRKLNTRLDVTDFAFNSTNFGKLNLTGTWNDSDQGVWMQGKIVKNDSSFVDVTGIIYPVKEEISMNFDAQNADARFLRKYLDKIVQDLTGDISGHFHLFGDLNNPTVEGDAFAKDCRFGIRYLNTFYTFSDSVKCLPDEFRIKNISIRDEKGNIALANGYVKHHLFDDFHFSVNVSYSNFMVFNASKQLNPIFHGIAFGSGTVSLEGTEDLINIDVSMQNTGNTRIELNFMEEPDIENYDFIRFVSAEKKPVPLKSKTSVETPRPVWENIKTEIRLNLILNATPQATIDMITDPVSGDKITGYGSGNLEIQYGTKIPLKVLGNYVIEQGKYNFSLQQFFYRIFDIQEGSSIAFRGDPYTAELKLKANYTVVANLEELDQQLIENRQSARSNVPVNCILVLTGPLNHPAIAFDLDLPGATAELSRQVKSYIRTEDMMNRQIVYLLVLSRFYTAPEYMRDAKTTDLSILTSTLSTQISSLLGTLSDKFQFGTTFHQSNIGEQTSTEVELMLSSQLLNDRLIINGNFGYLNNPILTGNQNNVPWIGDFDLEYKLTKNGNVRLKGFHRYDYRNYYSIMPEMTQGLGILFRRDFNRFRDLFLKKNAAKEAPKKEAAVE